MDHAINSPGHVNNVVGELNTVDKYYLKKKWNFLENYQVTTYNTLECLPVHHNMYQLNFYKHFYI